MSDEPAKDSPQPQAPEKQQVNLASAVQKLSEKKPEVLEQMMMAMGTVGHPLINKLNEAHVTKVLDLIVQHDVNQFELAKQSNANESRDNQSKRWFVFITFVILVALTVFVLIYFKDKPDVLHPILTGLGGLVAGGLGGYGIGKRDSK